MTSNLFINSLQNAVTNIIGLVNAKQTTNTITICRECKIMLKKTTSRGKHNITKTNIKKSGILR